MDFEIKNPQRCGSWCRETSCSERHWSLDCTHNSILSYVVPGRIVEARSTYVWTRFVAFVLFAKKPASLVRFVHELPFSQGAVCTESATLADSFFVEVMSERALL